MLARSLLLPWCVATTSILVIGSRAANAACVISGVRPTVPLPTMAVGQQFSFLATADCEKVRFRIPGTTFVKVPQRGPDTGARPRTYKVALTEDEWNSVVDEADTTFTWSIIGTSSAGVTTRVTTTNELKPGVTIDLSEADAKLVGEARDEAGYSVSGAGDVDGDGRDDVLVGAPGARAAYLVLGPVTGTFDLALADAKLVGEAGGGAGGSVSGAGDVDGDGHDDLLVGALGNDEGGAYAGAAYLVLGPVTGTLDLSLADAKLVGEGAGEQAGGSVSGAGDVDGDGHDDVLVGAVYNQEGGTDAGAAYLVLGPVTGTLDLSLADAKLVGEHPNDAAGYCVSDAGDVDGDGHDDLLVGTWQRYQGGGNGGGNYDTAYVVQGPVTGALDLSLADAKLVGDRREGPSNEGQSVSGAGDVDGDGHDDLLLGAWPNDAGAAYLVLGPVTGTLELSLADVADAKLVGEHANDFAGFKVSGAGDVDGDGHDDLLVGAPGIDDGNDHSVGGAYLVLGPVTGTFDLSLASAKLVGEEASDYAGWPVSGAGDVDGDGQDDLLVGAFWNDEGAYVVYGGGLF
jgi:hypothetical protein